MWTLDDRVDEHVARRLIELGPEIAPSIRKPRLARIVQGPARPDSTASRASRSPMPIRVTGGGFDLDVPEHGA